MPSNIHMTRRSLLAATLATGAAGCLQPMTHAQPAPAATKPDSWRGLKVGIASYSLRKMSRAQAIVAIKRVGLSYMCIKDFHVTMKASPEETKASCNEIRAAGITPLSVGVISTSDDADVIRAAFAYARDCGVPTLVSAPTRASLPLMEKMAREYDIKVAIHNHGPEDKQKFHTPADMIKAIDGMDPRIGICIDAGHTARAGGDPAADILKYKDRLHDFHIKDLASVEIKAKDIEAGRGVLDLRAMLKALVEIKYANLVGIEYEKDPEDVMPGLSETVGYLRGVLSGV